VIDQPDVQGFHKQDTGASLSRIIGTDVYSNSGKRLGEVEDFIVAEGGYLYAVIDIQDGPLESVIELPDGDKVVVPWNELRTQSVPED
jgi:sporulation protein YlmC with PRC-barrel domain